MDYLSNAASASFERSAMSDSSSPLVAMNERAWKGRIAWQSSIAFRLAWRNITRDRIRLIIATIGVAFAVLLMTVQLGLLIGFAHHLLEPCRQRPSGPSGSFRAARRDVGSSGGHARTPKITGPRSKRRRLRSKPDRQIHRLETAGRRHRECHCRRHRPCSAPTSALEL